ncbi:MULTISPECIES: branched-chain amino acid ABC transporter substrate-binding protein [unclassified Massilia]|uniref:branched-chain amino acid ABC transporter substrate-binding protein n=1 Tax=unclassified Massilia TaxID=2609279 RepID=UPI001B8309C8|nr:MULTISPECIES: branched-chain amino acid ABC transporter substrate-binding protein [unclassified Massilia]MBQ5940217.1 branched-chain amino acid ABC transporter substrate-binding protein [Massilia sp. AB1]MBQ5962787.1 branched-chain amino acid ABC transporter substrate-binding protein [Massilia sp. ZL223]
MNKQVMMVGALAAAAGMATAQEVVKIGHAAAVTGPVAYFGKDTENGARMAVEALNARGVSIGGKKVTFQLMAEDDGGDPKQATSVAQKLVDAKIHGMVGHETSGTTIPASKIYHAAGIPQISPSSTSPKYTQQGFNTTFRVVANDVQLGQALGRYALDGMKAKRVAVVDDRTAYGQGLVTEFSRSLQKQGGSVVAREFTHDKATDFSAIITRIRASKPDLVFFGGMSATAGPMLRQMKQLGMNVRMMGGDGICSDEIHKLSGGTMADGQVVCAEAGGVQGEAKAGMDKFRADYKKRFGIDVQINAPYAYDAVMVMAEAMVKAGSSAPAKYLPVLASIQYKGVTGPIAFDAKGDIRDGTITLYGFKGGKRSVLTVTK